MIKPHGASALKPLFVADPEQNRQLQAEAETLPSLLLNSAAAANAVPPTKSQTFVTRILVKTSRWPSSPNHSQSV